MPVSSTRTVRFNSTKFADDFAGYIQSCRLHALFDCIDIYCAGSANDSNRDKTLGFWLGSRRLHPQAWDGAAYAGDEPTYRPTPQHTAWARLRWLPPEGAHGKALGCIVGPAAATKQWDSTAAAMLGQMNAQD